MKVSSTIKTWVSGRKETHSQNIKERNDSGFLFHNRSFMLICQKFDINKNMKHLSFV